MRILRYIAVGFCIIPFLWSCGEQQSQAPPPPKVVSQKITITENTGPKPTPPAAPKASPAKPTVAAAKLVDSQKPPPPPPPPPKPVAKEAAPPVAKPETPPAPAPVAKAEAKPEKEVAAKKPEAEKEAAGKEPEAEGLESGSIIAYIPEGKIDPFAPLFREQKAVVKEKEAPETAKTTKAGEAKPKKKRRIPRTPLETMDLSQLKLVGIVRTPSGNKALVQDATGKGYVLNKGTYIGINSGFVTKITKSKVIIEEETEDIYGKVSARERELVLQKPLGEI